MKLSELKIKTPAELLELAQSLGIENISRAKKQTLIFAILKYPSNYLKLKLIIIYFLPKFLIRLKVRYF